MPELVQAVQHAGYQKPTPIQRDAIPAVLQGRDVVGCAQTGTGKTAAFTLPVLQHLDSNADQDGVVLRALVLTPTRELASQIGDSFEVYGRNLELWHTVIFGGVSDKKQIRALREGVDALIATPGRLLDLMGRGHIDLSGVDLFVLDEADRMLDMGFLPDVRRVLAKLPDSRQTLLFSATMPSEIRSLADGILNDPVSVAVARVSAPAERVEQFIYFVDKGNKRRLLVEMFSDPAIKKALVFSRTKHGANRIVKELDRAGIGAAAIHGNKSQGARERALLAFRNDDIRILVATDIAARGIDVEGITHVINYDLPNVQETYVHRIGRTARAGASGMAFSMCDDEERDYLIDIERLIERHIERVENHGYPATEAPPPLTDLTSRQRPRSAGGKRRPRQQAGRGGNRGRPAGGHPNRRGRSAGGGRGGGGRGGGGRGRR